MCSPLSAMTPALSVRARVRVSALICVTAGWMVCVRVAGSTVVCPWGDTGALMPSTASVMVAAPASRADCVVGWLMSQACTAPGSMSAAEQPAAVAPVVDVTEVKLARMLPVLVTISPPGQLVGVPAAAADGAA